MRIEEDLCLCPAVLLSSLHPKWSDNELVDLPGCGCVHFIIAVRKRIRAIMTRTPKCRAQSGRGAMRAMFPCANNTAPRRCLYSCLGFYLHKRRRRALYRLILGCVFRSRMCPIPFHVSVSMALSVVVLKVSQNRVIPTSECV